MKTKNILESGNKANKEKRPVIIYLLTIWSILGSIYFLFYALSNVILAIGEPDVVFRKQIHYPGGARITINNLIIVWNSVFPIFVKLEEYMSIIFGVLFILLAIGLFIGKDWGRKGFIVVSSIIVFWNVAFSIYHLKFFYLIYSTSFLLIAIWILRRKRILEYFHVTDDTPKLLQRNIGKIPVDLGLGITILFIQLIFESLTLIKVIIS
jgi:hypothetical protein